MRIQVMSDLHFEFFKDKGRSFVDSLDPTDVDVLILAGDIATPSFIENALGMLCSKYPRVLYTPGNHEYYSNTPSIVNHLLREIEKSSSNLHVLMNNWLVIDGVRFVGTTLWFRDSPMNCLYERHMADFSVIRDFTPWVYRENTCNEAFLNQMLDGASIGQPVDVVVTHHLPSEQCVHPQYKGDKLNRFFVSPIADEVPTLPRYWIFGHTHKRTDFEYRGCRFIANPLGYPHEGFKDFEQKLIIEVERER